MDLRLANIVDDYKIIRNKIRSKMKKINKYAIGRVHISIEG